MNPGIEVARTDDGPVEIRLVGFRTAMERRAARWRAVVQWGLLSLALAGAVSLGGLALRWDYQNQHQLRLALLDLRYARVQALCWRAMALDLPATRADVVPLGQREGRVRGCIERELTRLDGQRR